jgi:hypothetical protein
MVPNPGLSKDPADCAYGEHNMARIRAIWTSGGMAGVKPVRSASPLGHCQTKTAW